MESGQGTLSLAVLVEEYLSDLLDYNLSDSTVKAYQDRLRYWRSWLSSTGIALEAVSRDTVKQYLSDMRIQGCAPKYVRIRLSAVRCFFSWLVDEKGLLPKNPAARIRPIKIPRKLPRVLDEAEAEKITNAAVTPRERVIMELLYGSGIRRQELLDIRIEDLHLAAAEVLIRGKGGDEALQPISLRAVRAIEDWLPERARILSEAFELHREAIRLKQDGLSYRAIARALGISVPVAYKRAARPSAVKHVDQLLIGRHRGLKASQLRNIVLEIAKRTDVDQRVYPHLLRHCFATHLLNGGADLRAVQELMRLKNLATAQIYTHVSRKRLKEAYERAHPRARLD